MPNDEVLNKVKKALSNIIDPETRLDLGRMDIIHDIEVKADGATSLTFRPSSPICPMAYSLANSIKKELTGLDGVTSVKIKVENFNRANHLESLINDDSVQ